MSIFKSEKQAKTGQLGRKKQTKNGRCLFLAHGPPSKFVFISNEGTYNKTLGSVSRNKCHKIVSKGDPLGGEG